MLRTRLDRVDLQRTVRPLYGWTQATPKSGFIATDENGDYNFTVDVYPGMVFGHAGGETFDLVSEIGAGASDLGLIAQFIGGAGVDEVRDEGIGAIAIWSLGPDAEFEVLAPAFVEGMVAADEGSLLYAEAADNANAGKLGLTADLSTPTTKAVARLLEVISPTRIRIGGLQGTV